MHATEMAEAKPVAVLPLTPADPRHSLETLDGSLRVSGEGREEGRCRGGFGNACAAVDFDGGS